MIRETQLPISLLSHRAAEDHREERVRHLRGRFARVSRHLFRPARNRRLRKLCVAALPVILIVIVGLGFFASPWPPSTTLRHLASLPNCAAARAVGLAPAYRGGPGYWPWLDSDGDGIACEPYSRRVILAR
ncbi:excalibur calcium-binding domain-containing protein [Consotaella salsifontis]|uniref:excalibur calcium-binding domain-containing protein n=1 Tax=Consotaella salsifontis TaxID=1365950 RepID=UPI00099999FC|nr:excalibur calcium-binding domain-containing protein [Consotaella salsifontis]